jgi:hypothetical protein
LIDRRTKDIGLTKGNDFFKWCDRGNCNKGGLVILKSKEKGQDRRKPILERTEAVLSKNRREKEDITEENQQFQERTRSIEDKVHFGRKKKPRPSAYKGDALPSKLPGLAAGRKDHVTPAPPQTHGPQTLT